MKLEYEGSGVPRGEVPSSAFTHRTESGEIRPGLLYQVYLKDWWIGIADFEAWSRSPAAPPRDLDLKVRPRPDQVGLRVHRPNRHPRTGLYTFHVGSDDGSRFWIGEPRLAFTVSADASKPPAVKAWDGMIPPEPERLGQGRGAGHLRGPAGRTARVSMSPATMPPSTSPCWTRVAWSPPVAPALRLLAGHWQCGGNRRG